MSSSVRAWIPRVSVRNGSISGSCLSRSIHVVVPAAIAARIFATSRVRYGALFSRMQASTARGSIGRVALVGLEERLEDGAVRRRRDARHVDAHAEVAI